MYNLPEYNRAAFADFFANPQDSSFELDLSNCSVIECFNKYIEMRSFFNPKAYKQYSCVINKFKQLEEEFGVRIMPEHINDAFWSNFLPMLLDQGMAASSIATITAQIKSMLGWACKHRAKISSTFNMARRIPYVSKTLALTPDEVSAIYHFDLSKLTKKANRVKYVTIHEHALKKDGTPYLKRVRKRIVVEDTVPMFRSHHLETLQRIKDQFVLACNLGQRYSDIVRVSPHNFHRNIFTITQQKTGLDAFLDIDKFALDPAVTYKILEKYKYYAPWPHDVSIFNKYLRKILKLTGVFDDDIVIENKINGVMSVKTYKKYDLIASHTARRTFVTVNVMRGIAEHKIRRASGHRSSAGFLKYIRYQEESGALCGS